MSVSSVVARGYVVLQGKHVTNAVIVTITSQIFSRIYSTRVITKGHEGVCVVS
jgi:hypothetical protein